MKIQNDDDTLSLLRVCQTLSLGYWPREVVEFPLVHLPKGQVDDYVNL